MAEALLSDHASKCCGKLAFCAKIKGIHTSSITFHHSRTERTVVAVILCTAGILAVALAATRHLTGQVTRGLPVIYKLCLVETPQSDEWTKRHHESCGIDEEATRVAHETWERTEEFRRQVAANSHILTQAEKNLVTAHIEQHFLGEKSSTRQIELQRLLESTATRLQNLLSSKAYTFSEEELKQIQAVQTAVESLAVKYEQAAITKRDVRRVQDQLAPLLTNIQSMLTHKVRNAITAGPNIVNLVTRIDNLVARVGTVIRDLELAGETVPTKVSRGHRKAVDLVRTAKRACSTSRPESCAILGEVLYAIEAIREPLCSIDSPLLTFCH